MLTAHSFRAALAGYPTGVTIVTAARDGQVVAMAANSFTSVSLDPPLVLWCVGLASSRYKAFAEADRYTISVLADDHAELCATIARPGGHRPDLAHLIRGGEFPPAIRDAVAVFRCEARSAVVEGDHAVLIGHVHDVSEKAHKPLLFHRGKMQAMPLAS